MNIFNQIFVLAVIACTATASRTFLFFLFFSPFFLFLCELFMSHKIRMFVERVIFAVLQGVNFECSQFDVQNWSFAPFSSFTFTIFVLSWKHDSQHIEKVCCGRYNETKTSLPTSRRMKCTSGTVLKYHVTSTRQVEFKNMGNFLRVE